MSFLQLHPTIKYIDKSLQNHCGGEVLSLNPLRSFCTSYEELFDTIPLIDFQNFQSILSSLTTIVNEEMYHFPNNIFWDKDYFFTFFLNEIGKVSPVEQVVFLQKYVELYCSLLELFGKYSIIRFQYLHDFSYGFDWAKWVRKDREHRKEVLPFSLAFLQRMYQRGKELELLVQNNDLMYPQLNDEKFRNPFLFHRTIECESLLLRQLAEKNHIPIVAWETNGSIDWKKNYSELREIEAKNCGLTT